MEPRNLQDVILSLEAKVDQLLQIVSSQNIIIKTLSNKHNDILRKLDGILTKPNYTVSSLDIPIQASAPAPLPQKEVPDFRRGGRDNSPFPQTVIPKDHPILNQAEVVVPTSAFSNVTSNSGIIGANADPDEFIEEGPQKFPVTQKIISEKKKPLFPVGIEIFNEEDRLFFKCKTNALGKWMAQLPLGKFKVVSTALLPDAPGPRVLTQLIVIDGKRSPLILPELIVKA